MRIVVGLGNPGAEYAETRHNIGWMVLDRLRARWGFPPFAKEADGAVAVATGTIPGTEGEVGWLVKPVTYMNRSGRALTQWFAARPELTFEVVLRYAPVESARAREQALEPLFASMLVVVDDIHLPLGRMRFRPRGSDGGHNGLADLSASFGADNEDGFIEPMEAYPRVRVGVGSPPDGTGRIDWVLGRFAEADAALLDRACALAVEAVDAWARLGFGVAQAKYNGMDARDDALPYP